MEKKNANSSNGGSKKSYDLGKMIASLLERGYPDHTYIWNHWTLEALYWQVNSINQLEKERKSKEKNYKDL